MGRSTVLVLFLAVQSGAAAWKPFNLGFYHRAVSTMSPQAQKAFDQGLIWSFSFNYDEAMRAFSEAARLDPGLAMAHWGIALVNGPHINKPTVDDAHAQTAWESLAEAKKNLAGASPVERALVEALGARYAMPQPADRRSLDEAYAVAMAGVHRRFPNDPDVAALYAEALMDVHPWDQWMNNGTPRPGTNEALGAIDAALALAPRHPLALHLKIHALEASPHPERARGAADALRRLVPDAGHLVHMPAHIDVRLGHWKDAAAANEHALEADERYNARRPQVGFYRIYEAHNAHFLAYTAMMEGRKAAALTAASRVASAFPPEFVKENAALVDAFLTVRTEVLKRFGLWEEILNEKAPSADLPVSHAYDVFARGTAEAALGRVEAAENRCEVLADAVANVPRKSFWGLNPAVNVLAVALPYLEGEIAYRRGDLDRGITKLTEAVRLEDALGYDEPPPMMVPSRHALGAILLVAGKPMEAEAVYREDLKRYPENGWSLQGLERALRAQKRGKETDAVKARFRKAWARADIEPGSSCLCVRTGR